MKVYGYRAPEEASADTGRPPWLEGVRRGLAGFASIATIATIAAPAAIVLAMLFMYKTVRVQDELMGIQAAEIRGLELRIHRLEMDALRREGEL